MRYPHAINGYGRDLKLREGDRVILWKSPDQHTDLGPGDCGTIYDIDWPKAYVAYFDSSVETTTVVWVRWDRGGTLGLIAEMDNFTVIRRDEL